MRVGVIGGGSMGSGIAEVCARSGVDVTVVEADDDRAERVRAAIERSLDRAARSGKLGEDARAAAAEPLAVTTALEELEGADAAVEAILEDEDAKRDLFRRIDAILPDARFLASNTSSVPIMKLAAETSQRERVLGLHFFNPVPVLPLVELVRSIMTSTRRWPPRAISRRGPSASPASTPRTGPASWSTRCSCLPARRHPHVRVRLRLQGGHRPRHGAGLRAPDGAARALRPHRPRHAARRLGVALRGVPRPRAPSRRRCSTGWSRRGCSAASRAAGSTTTRARPQARIDEWRATTCHRPSRRDQTSVRRNIEERLRPSKEAIWE